MTECNDIFKAANSSQKESQQYIFLLDLISVSVGFIYNFAL